VDEQTKVEESARVIGENRGRASISEAQGKSFEAHVYTVAAQHQRQLAKTIQVFSNDALFDERVEYYRLEYIRQTVEAVE
jgi:hypothetical protein